MTERCGIADALAVATRGAAVVRIVVAAIEGSAPREAGAAMLVAASGITGTIGGGQLEFEAIAHARTLLAQPDAPWPRDLKTWPLGPSLGQWPSTKISSSPGLPNSKPCNCAGTGVYRFA